MHAPAKVQQVIAPRTACGKLYAKLPLIDKVSNDPVRYPVNCPACLGVKEGE